MSRSQPVHRRDVGPGRACRYLLAAYPRAFRDRYGAEMEAAFQAERGHSSGPLHFWVKVVRDTAASALREHLRPLRPRRASSRSAAGRASRSASLAHFGGVLSRDARFALRRLCGTPTQSLLCTLMLATGIGASALLYNVVDTLLISPPGAITDPARLVRVTPVAGSAGRSAMSYPDFLVLRETARTFSDLAAYAPMAISVMVDIAGAAEPAPAVTRLVTANYFEVLGIAAQEGRVFDRREEPLDQAVPATVLAAHFWRALGADPAVVGRPITIDGKRFRVVGVATDGFTATNSREAIPDMWLPVMARAILDPGAASFLVRDEQQSARWLSVIGRLRPATVHEEAQLDVDAVAAHLDAEFGVWSGGTAMEVAGDFRYSRPFRSQLVRSIGLLAALVALVLVTVCANVSTLQLARLAHRRPELAIRGALGAGGASMIREVLFEALLLAGLGSALGLGATVALTPSALRAASVARPEFRFYPQVFLVAISVAFLLALFAGVFPALAAARTAARGRPSSTSVGAGPTRGRSALVIFQVAASVVVLTSAALLARSLFLREAVNPGFDYEGRGLVAIDPGADGYEPIEADAVVREILERGGSTAEISNASAMLRRPFGGGWAALLRPPDESDAGEDRIRVWLNAVAPEYFATMGIEVLSGRDFNWDDARGGEGVVILNEAAAAQLWPEAPLGKSIALHSDAAIDRVVGVVANTDYRELGEEPEPIVYMPLLQAPRYVITLVAAAQRDTASSEAALRRIAAEVAPNLMVSAAGTVAEAFELQISTYRSGARIGLVVALLAALFAALGLYALMSCQVATEQRELGVRMALGAGSARVTCGVIRRGLGLAGCGIVVGVGIAFATTPTLSAMLFGVGPRDPFSFAVVIAALFATALAASALPARRAARVDPGEALRRI